MESEESVLRRNLHVEIQRAKVHKEVDGVAFSLPLREAIEVAGGSRAGNPL